MAAMERELEQMGLQRRLKLDEMTAEEAKREGMLNQVRVVRWK